MISITSSRRPPVACNVKAGQGEGDGEDSQRPLGERRRRAVLACRPDVALVAATHALALRVCYETPSYEVGSVLSLSSEKGGCALEAHTKGVETSKAGARLSEIRSEWVERIPKDRVALWDWLLAQEQSVLMALLASDS